MMSLYENPKHKVPRLWRWLSCVVLIGLVAGMLACSASPHTVEPPPPTTKEVGIGLCESNSDCLAGQICSRRYCKTQGGLPGQQVVSLYAIPPSNHRYSNAQTVVTSQQFLGVDASKLHDKSIFLRAAYLVEGRVHVAGDDGKAGGKPVEARVRFIDRESITGKRLEVVAEADPLGSFRVRLTHGVYEVEITPKDNKHPPHRIPKVNVERNGKLQLLIPQEKDYPRLTGRIVTPDKNTPVAGLRVQVFSATGKPISIGVFTDEKGVFNAWLSAKEKPHRLRVHMRLGVDEPGKPRIAAHPQIDIPFAPASLSAGEKIDLGDLKIGHVPDKMIRISGIVRATLQSAGEQTLKGCEVHLVGTIDLKTTYKDQPIKGYYRVSITSKEGGLYRGSVLPGSYQIEVLPPINSREVWARASIQQDNLLNDKDVEIRLKPKPKVTGRICQKGDKGQCVKDVVRAQVQAVWRSNLGQPVDPGKRPPVPVPETPIQLSESKGWYTLPLDPGVYDLIFIPPTGSGLARRIQFNVRVEASDKPQNIDAYLNNANHLAGKILGPDRFPIPNTVIEMYSHPKDPNEPIRLLGRATTNTTGDFSLAYYIPSND